MDAGAFLRKCARPAVAGLMAAAFCAASTGDSDLTSMSLEDLMQVKVNSVSRKDQQMKRVAAAVFVITQEDIRRSGAATIPEALRLVPGMQVARISASQYAVSARGFNSRVADKMLVLIDGRCVYNDLYSGVFWDQNEVMLADVERIEVIRGPGGTMWGANAVNGVINVITRKAEDTQGGFAEAQAGNSLRAATSLRYGGRKGNNLFYRLAASYSDTGNEPLQDGSSGADAWHTARMGGRLEWQPTNRDSLTFHADGYLGGDSERVDSIPGFSGVLPASIAAVSLSGGYALGRWERNYKNSDIALQVYFNREARTEAMGGGRLNTTDFDFQHHLRLGKRHDVIWGLSYRLRSDYVTSTHPLFNGTNWRDDLFGFFAQDEIALAPNKLSLTVGSKFEHNSFTGFETQPQVRLVWMPTASQSFWGAASRAVRLPSIKDLALNIYGELPPMGPMPMAVQINGNQDFRSEALRAYEGGYRRQLSSRATLDVAAFVNDYSHLQNMLQQSPRMNGGTLVLPFTYANAMHGRSTGVETAASWNPTRSWRLALSHAWLAGRFSYDPSQLGTPRGDDNRLQAPRNTLDARSWLDLGRRWALDARLYYTSSMGTPDVPHHLRADLRVGYRVAELGEISLGVNDAFEKRHLEFVAVNDYLLNSLVQRSFYIKFVRSF